MNTGISATPDPIIKLHHNHKGGGNQLIVVNPRVWCLGGCMKELEWKPQNIYIYVSIYINIYNYIAGVEFLDKKFKALTFYCLTEPWVNNPKP